MIVPALRAHILGVAESVFVEPILVEDVKGLTSSIKVEALYGLSSMQGMDAFRLSNESTLSEQDQAIGFDSGLFQAEVENMIIVEVHSASDLQSSEDRAWQYLNLVLVPLVYDRGHGDNISQVFADSTTSMFLDFATCETDEIGQAIVTVLTASLIWKGTVNNG